MYQKRSVNDYTIIGRQEIHKNLGVNVSILHDLMDNKESLGSVEFMDNRISLYAAQKGRCGATGKILELENINCHHKIPRDLGGKDNYENLILLHKDVHILIHAKEISTIKHYLNRLKINKSQLRKINKLRKIAQLKEIIAL